MLKNILKLDGVEKLNKKQQKELLGGTDPIDGGGGSGGGGNGGGPTCFCLVPGIDPNSPVAGLRVVIVPCNSICPNGDDPFST